MQTSIHSTAFYCAENSWNWRCNSEQPQPIMPFGIVAYVLTLFSWTTFVETAVYYNIRINKINKKREKVESFVLAAKTKWQISESMIGNTLSQPFRVYLGVKTCEVFLCFVTIMFVLSVVLTSLFSLFYVTHEGDRFLHRGWAAISEQYYLTARVLKTEPFSVGPFFYKHRPWLKEDRIG